MAVIWFFVFAATALVLQQIWPHDALWWVWELCVPLAWLTAVDLDRFEIPDLAIAMIATWGLVHLGLWQPSMIPLHVATGIFITAILWGFGAYYFHRTGTEGLGIGDAKLFGATGLILGPWPLPELILFSAIGGILGYLLSSRRAEGIPFGPYIAYALLILTFFDPIFWGIPQ